MPKAGSENAGCLLSSKGWLRKNWLFFGDANAGERSALIYSIIENCRRHGVEPAPYDNYNSK